MSWLVAALVLAPGQVEVPATVAPLGRLLPSIGKRLGLELVADPNVRDDVMGIVIPPSTSRVLSSNIMPLMTVDMRMNQGHKEVTEALPNGLPQNFQVAAPIKSETGFVSRQTGYEPLFMTDRSVAQFVASGAAVPGKELRAATQESLLLRLTVPGIFIGHLPFVEQVYDPRAPWGPYTTQPSAARARVNEIAEEMKRQRRGGE
mgnify:CR=1 FL=1